MGAATEVRWVLGQVLALLILSGTAMVGLALADGPAAAERDKLAAEALALNNRAYDLADDGQFARAADLLKQAVALWRQAYPADQYPDGQIDVAASLTSLAAILAYQGQFAQAEPYARDALTMYRKLSPSAKFPDGRPELAGAMTNLAAVLRNRGAFRESESLLREALDMYRKLYPPDRLPEGGLDTAKALGNLGGVLQERGELAQAEPYFRESLELRRRLYPSDKFPDGHPDLATGLNNLGMLLAAQGEYGKAEPYLREALEMYRRLYPAKSRPGGHPGLALALNNLGYLLDILGKPGEAEPYLRDAVDMFGRLYPPERHPNGHPDTAMALNNLASSLKAEGKADEAARRYRQCLLTYRKLYPEGSPEEAKSLNNLATSAVDQGDYAAAEQAARDSVALRRKLYPRATCPEGHPEVAFGLTTLGTVLLDRDKSAEAADVLKEALSIYDRLGQVFADAASEAETLNYRASLPAARDHFLEATARAGGAEAAGQYAAVWRGKAALLGALQRRERLLRAAAGDPDTRRQMVELLGTRQDLARLLLAPAHPGDGDRARRLKNLTETKEKLEKDLDRLLPPPDRETPDWADLARRLPRAGAFADIYRYQRWDAASGRWDGGHYAAFVVRDGATVRRVELDDGAAIDKDVAQWRQDIDKGLGGESAGRLKAAVWDPIAKALGDGVDTVYVCPDGALAAMPWAALPGDRPGGVLLEGRAFAVVPSGPWLLERLARAAPAGRGAGVLLAVGGVAYDRADAADKTGKPWPALPATGKEHAAVTAQASQLAPAPEVVERSGADADAAHLLKDLPRARWAHLATHGFFAAPDTQERKHLFQEEDFLFGLGAERRGAAARNPLTQTGLVLAGANQPNDGDPGLLTGEAIAGLDLDGMDLAVLSACRTGLGEAARGEGVFGLQRAFHVAGAKNVVASLWAVDDESTAALMNLFYYHLWGKGEPPLEALRHAQLELYRNPQGVPALARGRGAAGWDEAVRVVTAPPGDPQEPPRRPAAVKDWAAFVLSGTGR